MGKLKSSSEDPNETTSKVTSRIWNVVWFIVKWCFRFALAFMFGVVGFAFALGGVRLPKFDFDFDSRPDPGINPKRLRKDFPNLTLKKILDEFGKQLEELEQQGKLKPEQEKVVRKIRKFDRSKYDRRLKNLFNDDEIEEFLLLILSLLGVEVS